MPPKSCHGQLRSDREVLGDFSGRFGGNRSLGTYRGQLLILQRAYALRQAEQANKARRVALLIYIVFTERDEPLVVERMLARTTGNRYSALVQLERHGAGDAFLRHGDKGVVRFALGGPPSSLVHEIRISRCDQILRRQCATVEHELLELGVGGVEQGTAGRFVHSARL